MPDPGSHLIRSEHRIRCEQPYDYPSVLQFLQTRALTGVESVDGSTYRRTFSLGGQAGVFEVAPESGADALQVTIWYPDVAASPAILSRVAEVFGLDKSPAEAIAHLSRDPLLHPLVTARPGLRVPGAWGAFEVAVRAVTGQQVTLQAATHMVARAARICGTPFPFPEWEGLGLCRLFPEPAQLASADLFDVGMPQHRMAALRSLAALAAADPDIFEPDASNVKRLLAQPGIGDWTVQYIGMRAHRDSDAFPVADVVIRRMLTGPGEARPTPSVVLRRAEAWRPWRAWATIHLWTESAQSTQRTAPRALAAAAAATAAAATADED